jgi:hypothetical protein
MLAARPPPATARARAPRLLIINLHVPASVGTGPASAWSAARSRPPSSVRGPRRRIDVPLIVAASELEERHTLSFWDALVVEAARRAGATRLVTENLQSGRSLGGVTVESPFA